MKSLVVAFAAMLGTVAVASYTAASADRHRKPQEVLVVASDFAFQTDDTIRSGLTTFKLVNHGVEPHLMQVVRLEQGRSLSDMVEHMAAGRHLPSWARYVGGPSVPPAADSSRITVDLEPGEYALLCFISSHDKVSHVAKGMVKSLTVVPAERVIQTAPEADVRMILDDYSFQLMEPIRAGRRVIRVENVARQPHEVAIVRVQQPISEQDLQLWLAGKKGPPPHEPVGGALALSQGEVNYVTADFVPGHYVLICYVPDAGDGLPHTRHGMIRQLEIR